MGAVEGPQTARQPVVRNGLDGSHGQYAALKVTVFRQHQFRGFGARKTARASTKNRAPTSVSSMPRPTRWNSFAPCRVSSAAIAALAADCVRLSDAAARVTCCRSATATKTRSCSSVMHGMMPQAVPAANAAEGASGSYSGAGSIRSVCSAVLPGQPAPP
jgi:hypothetical protein